MMKRIIDYMLSWVQFRRVTAAIAAAREWESKSKKLSKSLEELRNDLGALQFELKEIVGRIEEKLDEATALERQYQTAVDQLRNENKVLSETVIPTLVSQHKLILARYEAEISNQVKLMIASKGTEG